MTLTSPRSLLTSIWRASRPVSAGKLIAGPRLLPSSAFLNWTTTLGIWTGSGRISGLMDLEYAERCLFGGGSSVAMLLLRSSCSLQGCLECNDAEQPSALEILCWHYVISACRGFRLVFGLTSCSRSCCSPAADWQPVEKQHGSDDGSRR